MFAFGVRRAFFLGLTLVFCAVHNSARACRCAEPDVAALYAQSSAVFEGRVLAVNDERVEFAVTQFWHGRVEQRIFVQAPQTTSCGVDFVVGQHYVVFVPQNGEAHACATFAAADFSGRLALGAGEIPFSVADSPAEEGTTPTTPRADESPRERVQLTVPHASQVGCGSCSGFGAARSAFAVFGGIMIALTYAARRRNRQASL